MQIQDCVQGLRVIYKNTGKVATVNDVDLGKQVIEIEFENGMLAHVPPSSLDPVTAATPTEPAPSGPMRPCPNCAAKMPLDVTTCPACGFEYGVKKSGGIGKILVAIIVLAVVAFVVWKFVLKR